MTLTVRELKKFIKDLPDENKEGELFGIWIQTGIGLSSPVTEICKLNSREDGCDIYFGNEEVFKEV